MCWIIEHIDDILHYFLEPHFERLQIGVSLEVKVENLENPRQALRLYRQVSRQVRHVALEHIHVEAEVCAGLVVRRDAFYALRRVDERLFIENLAQHAHVLDRHSRPEAVHKLHEQLVHVEALDLMRKRVKYTKRCS